MNDLILLDLFKLGIGDHVRFVHGVSDAELVELMGSAELACVPSLYEGFSLPTAELMACASPLVVSRAGAIPEVVGTDGDTALLTKPGDSEALAARLRFALDQPDLRQTVGARGRQRIIDRWSWKHTAAQTVEQYRIRLEGEGR